MQMILMFILYPATLLNLFTNSNSYFVKSLGIFVYKISFSELFEKKFQTFYPFIPKASLCIPKQGLSPIQPECKFSKSGDLTLRQ